MCALIAVCVLPLLWNGWFCCTWGKENKKSPHHITKKWWLHVCSGNLGVSPLKHFLETSFSFFTSSSVLLTCTPHTLSPGPSCWWAGGGPSLWQPRYHCTSPCTPSQNSPARVCQWSTPSRPCSDDWKIVMRSFLLIILKMSDEMITLSSSSLSSSSLGGGDRTKQRETLLPGEVFVLVRCFSESGILTQHFFDAVVLWCFCDRGSCLPLQVFYML